MADFIEAFKTGIAAAKAAELARKEIDEIFTDVDRQIREGSEGKVSIKRGSYYVTPEIFKGILKGLDNFAKVMGARNYTSKEGPTYSVASAC